MKKLILIMMISILVAIAGIAITWNLSSQEARGGNEMERKLIMGKGESLSDAITDGKQFKYNVYSADGNLTDIRYGFKLNNITITTPINTICEWDASKPLRHCYQDIELEYMRDSAIAINPLINFTAQITNKQYKNFKVTMPSSLSKGNNYTARIEFDYPANIGEEWNLSFNAFGNEWKIDPEISICSILSSARIYTLTTSLTNAAGVGTCMNITTSNVWLDCQGWENYIDGNDTSSTFGVYVNGSATSKYTNISILNCNLTDWERGVYHYYTENSTLDNITASSNTAAGAGYSIWVRESKYSNLSNMIISNNNNGFYIQSSSNNSLTNISALNNSVENVYIASASNNNFKNIIALNSSQYGIYLSGSNKNQIINSTIRDNKGYGLYIITSMFNNITNCTIENNSASNSAGILIQSHASTATSNSSYNRFWNNIINNTPNGGKNVITSGINYTNYFNTTQTARTNIVGGANIGGNYWSDYTGTDGNADDIGDTPYVINSSAGPVQASNMTDALPLVLTAPPDTIPPIVTIISPTNTTINTATGNIPFNVSLDEVGSSCLLELDKTPNITMTKQSNNLNFNITNLTNAGSHNARFYCNDTSNNMNLSGMNNVTFNTQIVTDTCTYSSGEWNVNCADNCVISSEVDLNNNRMSIIGNGLFILDANIKRYSSVFVSGNCGIIQRNGRFKE